MICGLISIVVGAIIFAAISAFALMIAHKIVLKESMEYGEAFKVMFFAAVATQIVNLIVSLTLAGGEHEYLLYVIPSVVLFIAVTFLLDSQVGLHLHQAAGVGIVMVLLWLAFSFAVTAILSAYG